MALLVVACNGDEPEIADPEPVEGCAYGGAVEDDSSTAGDFDGGVLYGCSGTRTATVAASVCKTQTCISPQPIQEFTFLGYGPFVTDEDLNFSEDFTASPLLVPPNTGACCTENAPEESVLLTAQVDCAARACLSAHDEFFYLYADAGNLVDAFDDGNEGDSPEEAFAKQLKNSAKFYTSVLEDDGHFSECTNALHSNGSYNFPQYPQNGLGAIKDVAINDFECALDQCMTLNDLLSGEAPACTDNPNWFEGNKGPPYVAGSAEPQSGSVSLAVGQGVKTKHNIDPSSDALLSYQRYLCGEPPCLFLVADIHFDLNSNIKIGPLTFHDPEVELLRPAAGIESEDEILVADGEIALRILASVSFGQQELFGGARVPMTVRNAGTARLTLENGIVTLEEARFPLIQGAIAELRFDPTPCNEP